MRGCGVNTVLFLCTGNYYRSRYAEILFRWLARESGLEWSAASRGLRLCPSNPGPMSRHTIAALQRRGIPLEPEWRLPLAATEGDFHAARHVVAVKEAEHRPLVERNFPAWLARVEFWHVDDLDCCEPDATIAHLEREVAGLLERLQVIGRVSPPVCHLP